MRATRKPGTPSETDSSLVGEMPRLPEALVTRFGDDARKYQRDLDIWWDSLRSFLVRKLDVAAQPSGLTERVSKLENDVKQLQGSGS